MPYFVYILHSRTADRYYCGQTDNIKKRVAQHNDLRHTLTRTTKRFSGPWILVWSREFDSRTGAMKLERMIKKRGIRRFLSDQGGC